MFLPRKILEEKLLRLLAEDIGQGDVTTCAIIPAQESVQAEIVAKAQGIVAGIEEAVVLSESLWLKTETLVSDGQKVRSKQVLIRISGDARTILTAERTLLNILSRMSGIATATRLLVEKLQKTKLKTKIASTRKTAPGLMYFDKKAVFIGGGDTHRLHLDDMILIKDNHIAIAGSIEEAVKKAKEKSSFTKKIEVEVTKPDDALVAAKKSADIIMLDNFKLEEVEKTIMLLKREKLREKVLIEASGGITTDNVLDFASLGVDIVSLGEITCNARTLDISLEITGKKRKHTTVH